MEQVAKQNKQSKVLYKKDKKERKIQSIYSRCLLTRKILLNINNIGKNLIENLEEYINKNFEGKCGIEGYIKQGSTKIIEYSCGAIERGNIIVFDVVFECSICFPVEGMLINCVAKNITKAGIRAESSNETPSPIIVFVAKDHHYNSKQFNNIKEGDELLVRVIGQRFELNDKYISIIAELVQDFENIEKPKPRLIIS